MLVNTISAKSRSGAEISDYLENKFIECAKRHDNLQNPESAPRGKTKNPWDARVFYKYHNDLEEIWIDFKAIKNTQEDSNPDIGTPDKIIKFIEQGGFYLLYIYVFYDNIENGIKFSPITKSYFLKDINHTFRRTPTNQLQVNFLAEPEYRTREEFVNLLFVKLKESYKRERSKIEKREKEIDIIQKEILKLNKEQENKFKNL